MIEVILGLLVLSLAFALCLYAERRRDYRRDVLRRLEGLNHD